MDLTIKRCIPCESGQPPLTDEQEDDLVSEVNGWELTRDETHKLQRKFRFKDFVDAMAFVNKVADLAEGENHHPDIYVFYNKVKLSLYTHAIGGLSENDFILAAKINRLL